MRIQVQSSSSRRRLALWFALALFVVPCVAQAEDHVEPERAGAHHRHAGQRHAFDGPQVQKAIHMFTPAQFHSSLCCSHVYDDAARNTYAHLSGRRVYRSPSGRAYLPIGLPALQQMLGAWS